MKIGLMSDTHSYLDDKIFEHFDDCDEIWHAGDVGDEKVIKQLQGFKPLKVVYGNIDTGMVRNNFPLDHRFVCEGIDVWMTHIGGYPGRYNKRVRVVMKENPPKLFICGHSHILKVMPDKKHDLLHMNPGACGKHGFHQIRTILKFSIDDAKIHDLKAIELGLRAAI